MVKLSSAPSKRDILNFQTNIDRLIHLVKKENRSQNIKREESDLINFCLYLPGGYKLLNSLEHLPSALKAKEIRRWMAQEPELQELRSLNLSGLGLRRLPEEIGLLKGLITLSLNTNLLTRLPESIGKLTKLRYLMLANNHLKNLPISLCELKDLRLLLLNRNQFRFQHDSR